MGGNRALPAEREHGVTKKNGERGVLPTLQPVKCFSTGVMGMLVCFVSCCVQCWAPRGNGSMNPFGLNICLTSTACAALDSSRPVFLTDCGFTSHCCTPVGVTVVAASLQW